MQKINFYDLIKLIVLCNLFMVCLDIFGSVMVSIFVYLKNGIFIFNWDGFLYGSLTQALAGGTVFGIGLWLKHKLQERQEHKDQGHKLD